MADDAEQLRAQIPSSTDPDRLERMAREEEQREGKTCPRCFGLGGHAETCRRCLGTGRVAQEPTNG